MTVRVPRTDAAATALAERYASLDGELALVEGNRAQAIAATNAVADALALPIIAEQEQIASALLTWWGEAAPRLTRGKRKSIELGGCKIGTRSLAEKLEHDFDSDDDALDAVTADVGIRAKATKTRRSLDRKAIVLLLKGKTAAAAKLRALGFRVGGGCDAFFVSPIGGGAGETVAR